VESAAAESSARAETGVAETSVLCVVPKDPAEGGPRRTLGTDEVLGGHRRWYAVARCKRATHIVGVHHCTWQTLVTQLPGGGLCGSGAGVKGFDDKQSALKWYEKETKRTSCEVFEYVVA
jgi:hypothetical protein